MEQLSRHGPRLSALADRLREGAARSTGLERPAVPVHRPQQQIQVRLSATQVQQLVVEHGAGASTEELAQRFGISPWTVLAHLHRQGIELRPVRHHTPDDVVRLYGDGHSLEVIGQRLRMSPATFRRDLVGAGVAIRPRGPRPRA